MLAFVHAPASIDGLTVAGLSLVEHARRVALKAGAHTITTEPPLEGARGLVLDARMVMVTSEALQGVFVGDGHWLVGPDGSPAATSGDALAAWAHITAGAKPRGRRPAEGKGFWVTDRASALKATLAIRKSVAERLVASGVILVDPLRTQIDESVHIEPGALIWPDVTLLGATRIAASAEIQAGCWLVDTEVGADVVIKPHSVCEGARIGPKSVVGPMAHLRPGAVLDEDVKVGNFVEVKQTRLHRGSKASHLTYLGDADIGEDANIGAGTITCNYDGFGKHRTTIGPGAFVGSNTALVAPVTVGEGAIIGAGSVITRDVPAEALAVERAEQKHYEGKAPVVRERNRKRAGKEGR